jgi:integrase
MSGRAKTRIKVPKHPGVYKRLNVTGELIGYEARPRNRAGKEAPRTFSTLREAVQYKADVVAGRNHADARTPFDRYAREWCDTYKGRKSRMPDEETLSSYRFAIETYAIPFFGRTPLGEIKQVDLERFVEYLTAPPAKRGKGKGRLAKRPKPNTVRRYFAPMRALLATAKATDVLEVNQALGFYVKVRGEPRRAARPKYLTAEQTLALLEQIPPAHADLALLLSTTAARRSEPFKVRWENVSQDADGRPMISFPESKTQAGLEPIPLTPETARMLTRRRAEMGGAPDDLVFPSTTGTAIDPRNWARRVFKPAAERAGLVDKDGKVWATPHKLRHGVATLMAESGYNAHDISRILRHADGGRLAQQTYMHPTVKSIDFLDDARRKARQARRGAPTRAHTAPTPRPKNAAYQPKLKSTKSLQN